MIANQPHSTGLERRHGFTLVELLVVLAITVLLIALLLPAVQTARESGRVAVCKNNLRQLALAVQSYHGAHGHLPALYNGSFKHEEVVFTSPTRYWDEYHFHSWQVAVLPYIGESTIHDELEQTLATTDPSNQENVNKAIATYLCPSVVSSIERGTVRKYAPNEVIGTAARTDYESVGGVILSAITNDDGLGIYVRCTPGVWGFPVYGDANTNPYDGVEQTSFSDITDGLSKTIAIGEVAGVPELCVRGDCDYAESDANRYSTITRKGWAMSGPYWSLNLHRGRGVNEANRDGLYSFHSGGANVAYADGSVRLLSESTSPEVISAIATRSGGEVAN